MNEPKKSILLIFKNRGSTIESVTHSNTKIHLDGVYFYKIN